PRRALLQADGGRVEAPHRVHSLAPRAVPQQALTPNPQFWTPSRRSAGAHDATLGTVTHRISSASDPTQLASLIWRRNMELGIASLTAGGAALAFALPLRFELNARIATLVVAIPGTLLAVLLSILLWQRKRPSQRLLERFSQSIEKRTRRGETVRPHSRG